MDDKAYVLYIVNYSLINHYNEYRVLYKEKFKLQDWVNCLFDEIAALPDVASSDKCFMITNNTDLTKYCKEKFKSSKNLNNAMLLLVSLLYVNTAISRKLAVDIPNNYDDNIDDIGKYATEDNRELLDLILKQLFGIKQELTNGNPAGFNITKINLTEVGLESKVNIFAEFIYDASNKLSKEYNTTSGTIVMRSGSKYSYSCFSNFIHRILYEHYFIPDTPRIYEIYNCDTPIGTIDWNPMKTSVSKIKSTTTFPNTQEVNFLYCCGDVYKKQTSSNYLGKLLDLTTIKIIKN